jgi:oxygen-independent coproporphyrinogen III oxidase
MPGVYVSYPFCRQKCFYCNFASGVFAPHVEASYRDALRRELSAQQWPWTPETVYFGGGTPSDIGEFLNLIPGRVWREATVEMAPGQLPNAMPAGINRVSLGVQSFVDTELRRSGRKHDAAVVERDVRALRQAGIEEINIDLIAGLPGQTREGWQTSLDWVERLAPPHVSVYMIEIDADSNLGLAVLNHRREAPDDDLVASHYEMAVERLTGMGIPRYEISNFARPGHESVHNLKYWRREPYLGFGADAHSFDGAQRWQNIESPQEYSAAENPRQAATAARGDEERYFLGLRLTEGVEPTPREWTRWREPLERFLSAGLLERAGPRVRLTARGILLSNEVFSEFIELP